MINLSKLYLNDISSLLLLRRVSFSTHGRKSFFMKLALGNYDVLFILYCIEKKHLQRPDCSHSNDQILTAATVSFTYVDDFDVVTIEWQVVGTIINSHKTNQNLIDNKT